VPAHIPLRRGARLQDPGSRHNVTKPSRGRSRTKKKGGSFRNRLVTIVAYVVPGSPLKPPPSRT
jgi:hypothetical protein